MYLPGTSSRTGSSRKAPRDRSASVGDETVLSSQDGMEERQTKLDIDASTQTEVQMEETDNLKSKVMESEKAKFRLELDDVRVTFYTGFPSFPTLKAFYNFFGPSVENLKYSMK